MSDPILGVNIMPLSQLVAIVSSVVSGVTVTITVSIPSGGLHYYDVWLSDSATNPAETMTPPSSGNNVRWQGVTNSSGIAVVAFANSNAAHTWYLWSKIQKVSVSSAITAGV